MEKEAWEGGVRRRLPAYDAGVGGASSPAGHMHQPGKPIGFLAARKTPYAKKLLSKRLILFTVVILPFLIIFQSFFDMCSHSMGRGKPYPCCVCYAHLCLELNQYQRR